MKTSLAKDGTHKAPREIRMLEKVQGKWTLVGQSIHLVK